MLYVRLLSAHRFSFVHASVNFHVPHLTVHCFTCFISQRTHALLHLLISAHLSALLRPSPFSALLYPLACRYCFIPHFSTLLRLLHSALLHLAFLSVPLSCFISLTSQRVASPALALNSLFHLLTHCFSASAQLIASSLRPVRALPHSQRGALSLSEHCFLCVASQRITSLLAS